MNKWLDCSYEYLQSLKAKGFSKSTLKSNRINLERLSLFCQKRGIFDPNYVKETDIIDFAKEQIKFLKASTVNARVTGIKRFFSYLTNKKLISYDMSVNIEPPKTPKALPKQIPSPEEYLKLVKTIDCSIIHGFLYRCIIELLYGTGMRMEELINLRLKDIDIAGQKIHLSASKTLKDRIIPLPEIACKYLDAYLKSVRQRILDFANASSDLVFLNMRGNQLEAKKVNTKIKEYAKKAGLDKKLTSHSFRFAYATHLFENKADIRYISELLGHKSLSTTAQYIIISKKALVEVVKKHHPRERGRL